MLRKPLKWNWSLRIGVGLYDTNVRKFPNLSTNKAFFAYTPNKQDWANFFPQLRNSHFS